MLVLQSEQKVSNTREITGEGESMPLPDQSLRVRAQAAGAHCERLGGGTKAQARQSSAPNVLSGVLNSPWGLEQSDTTERLHFHFSRSCFGEENGSPLQCSCLENPRNGGTWWAAVYGVCRVGHD